MLLKMSTKPKAVRNVAYLGPNGTFAHIVASQRFGDDNAFFPKNAISEVFDFVRSHPGSYGVVPIENSSGGNIYGTIDELVDKDFDLQIVDHMELNVKLSLMGRQVSGTSAKKIYSHFAALNHCHDWLMESQYKNLEIIPTASTAEAAKLAAESDDSLALASSRSAKLYDLHILGVPTQKRNVTQFIVLGEKGSPVIMNDQGERRSTVVVTLPSNSGSLCDFLLPFKEHGVNLSRILSRPIKGLPHDYAFLIDIDGAIDSNVVATALAQSKKFCTSLRVIGNYSKYGVFES